MDAELPFAYESSPEPGAPPPRDPAWTGLEVAYTILFTLVAIVAITAVVLLVWALARRVSVTGIYPDRVFALVVLTLAGQTGGMAAGLGFFAFLLSNVPGARFWQTIHWRRLPARETAMLLAGGVGLMIVVQILGHVLPVPSQVPMDRLFTSQTAWLLVIYGVGIAPFFEEFFFRGLIYPSLRSTFDLGFSREEQQPWRLPIRVLAALGFVGVWAWFWLRHTAAPDMYHLSIGLAAALALLALAAALPGLYLGALGGLAHRLAQWRRPELLAILLTGFLFGLMHGAQLGWSWAAVLLLALVGIILTWARAATGSVMASWLVHSAYNGTLFFASYIATQGFHHFGPGLH